VHRFGVGGFWLSVNRWTGTPDAEMQVQLLHRRAGAAECQSVKTAAVETEVWAGFEVLHTAGIGHTVALFAELTAALQVRCFGTGNVSAACGWQLLEQRPLLHLLSCCAVCLTAEHVGCHCVVREVGNSMTLSQVICLAAGCIRHGDLCSAARSCCSDPVFIR
jgi:hypothetical protein